MMVVSDRIIENNQLYDLRGTRRTICLFYLQNSVAEFEFSDLYQQFSLITLINHNSLTFLLLPLWILNSFVTQTVFTACT